jgi:hypothetical protein
MEEDLALPLFQKALFELCAGDPHLLRPGLEHARWKVVKATCQVLARIPSPDSFKLFEPLLNHSSHLIRQTAVRSLAKSGSTRRAEILGEMLDDPEGSVRVATIEAFASIDASQAVSRLVAILQSESFAERDRQEQQVLYRVLAHFGGPEIIGALATQVGRDSPAWFQRTSRSLLAATSVIALISWPILTATMGSLSGTVVWLVVVVVGIAMLRDVANAKGDRQLELVEPAAICLSRIGGREAMSVLETASRTGPARVKRICGRVLSHRSSSGVWDGSSQGGA